MKLRVNNITNESIPYKKREAISYKNTYIEEVIINNQLEKNVPFIAFNKGEEIESCFESYNEDELDIYLTENNLLLVFKNYDKYFVLLELKDDILEYIKKNRFINFMVLNNNETEYYFSSNELKGIS